MTKPATTAAEYLENTRDELRQIELHPHDTGSIALDTFLALSQPERRALWAQASDDDKRGLALQIIRRQGHGPDEATIAMYLELMEERFGLSEIETAICGALERLALTEAMSARTARQSGLKDDATFFQRAANAYAKALSFYRAGVRPIPTQSGPTGWLLPSQRAHEAPHLLTKDGDWICTCAAGESMHWAKALIVGIEVGYDDLAGGAEVEADPPDGTPAIDDLAPGSPAESEPSEGRFDDRMVRSLVDRLTAARAKLAA